MDSVLSMPMNEFIELISFAVNKETEDQYRQQWISFLPFMSMGMLKYMSFNEYKDKCTGKNVDLRPANEIIEEIRELHGGLEGI